MTKLLTLLNKRGIKKAVVIDDVFDDAPRPDELNDDDWSTFFDDLATEEQEKISEWFPAYDSMNLSDLQKSEEFINILWENRKELSTDSSKTLFKVYEDTNQSEKLVLEKIVDTLNRLGLQCAKMGCKPLDDARDANLVIIDLFLGWQQSDQDMKRAVRRAKDLVNERLANPPIIILTSKSPRLNEERDVFRDEVGLLGSTFRVATKASLAEEGRLETILTRLVEHYEDAKRIAQFVYAWEAGLEQAQKRLIQHLRRLDLSDLAQIRALLLNFEGQELGEYLLDVADRVLQYEIEGNDNTIAAALDLNKVDLEKYPAPHLVGTSDLQKLVHRMVFIHPDRLRLSKANDKVKLQFGDLLRWKAEDANSITADVSLVVSPACDLARDGGTKRVMFLSGKLEDLHPKNWSYKPSPIRTAIIIFPNRERKWIKWDLKDIKALAWDELDQLINAEERLERIGRLREIYAIEIQQRLLTDLGRIGRLANLPAPFPVDISLFYVDDEGNSCPLNVEEIETAACYVGRDDRSQPLHRLVLTEQTCDKIEQTLQALDDSFVNDSAKSSLVAVKEDRSFFTKFERGEIEMPIDPGTKSIKGNGNRIYATIIRNMDFVEGKKVTGDSRKAALIIKVTDISKEAGNGSL